LTEIGVLPDGYDDVPPAFVLVPRRMIVPPTQRNPSPNATPDPPPIFSVPWKYNAELFGISVPVSTSVSFAMLALPLAARCAPDVLTELAQPLPAVPEFAHGQAVPVPSPKQNVANAEPFWWICNPSKVVKEVTVEQRTSIVPPGAIVTVSTACVMPAW
jgi:hypothetical protein